MQLDASDVARVRRRARRHGFYVTKSRHRSTHINNFGGLMLVNGFNNTVLAGVNYELDTEQAEYWIDRYVAEGRGWGAS